jgi:4'-phosphopantetheinyl transferase
MQVYWPKAKSPPPLLANEAHVWAVPLNDGDRANLDFASILTKKEQTRADEFRIERPRRQFVTTRAALRILLGSYLGQRPQEIAFASEGLGKPRLASQHASTDLRFNVSHSGDLGLVALTLGRDVGIDVEQRRAITHVEQIARRFFHPSEVDAVMAAQPNARNDVFLRCWTAKEAVLKAYGTGIAGSLDAFRVPPDDSFEGWVDLSAMPNLTKDSLCWLRRLLPGNGFVAAVAFVGERCDVKRHTLRA